MDDTRNDNGSDQFFYWDRVETYNEQGLNL